MNTCEDHDSVVVYDGRKCPVCELQEEHDDLEKERDKLRKERDEFEDETVDLAGQVKDLEAKVEDLRRQLLTKELKELEGGAK